MIILYGVIELNFKNANKKTTYKNYGTTYKKFWI